MQYAEGCNRDTQGQNRKVPWHCDDVSYQSSILPMLLGNLYRYKPTASQMSCDRFESIKRFLHFNNSLKNKKRVDKIRDWLFKICLIFEK